MYGGLQLENAHFATTLIKIGLGKHHERERSLGGKCDEAQNM